MIGPLYEAPHFTFRFADDRIIPRLHLEGIEAGRRVSVFKIDPTTGERLGLLAKATVGNDGWVDLLEPIIIALSGSARRSESCWFRLEADQNLRLQLGWFVAMMAVNLQRRRADDLATSGKLGLQLSPLLRQCLIWPDVYMLHVPGQLELKRFKLIWNRDLLCVSEFNADEHSSIGKVYPMVNARRCNPGRFDHLPHFVHQAQANLALSLVLDNAPDAV